MQPHSGIDANLVAFWSILAHRVEAPALERLGATHVNDLTEADWEALRQVLGNQRLLGMSLDAGGHLTHGFRPNISGKMFHQRCTAPTPRRSCSTTTRCGPAQEFKPLVLMAGYSAYPRQVNFATMREIADEVGATLMVDMAHFAGLVAGKVFTGDYDPCPTRTSRPRRRTSPCVARVAVWCWAAGVRRLVDRGCPMVLGGPLPHSWPPRRSRSPRPGSRSSRPTRGVADNAVARRRLPDAGRPWSPAVRTTTSCFSMSRRSGSPAGRPSRRCSTPASSRTATRSRDPNGAWYTSGLRIGTPALTSRGFGPAEFDRVAELMVEVLSAT